MATCVIQVAMMSLFAQPQGQSGEKIGKINLGKQEHVGESSAKPIEIRPKDRAKYIVVDWITPSQLSGNELKGKVDIELKIFSSAPVLKEHLSLYIDGKKEGGKADEVNLFSTKYEFTYKNSLTLPPGDHSIQVEVKNEAGISRSQPMNVKVVSGGSNLPAREQVFVYWSSPDPLELEGKPFVLNSRELELSMTILSPSPIGLSQIQIFLNDRKLAPTPRAVLRGTDKKFTFRDYLQFDESQPISKIYLKVFINGQEYRSEALLVDYSPFRPNLHMLSIGTKTNLQYTIKDAQDFAKLYEGQGLGNGHRIFSSINVETLTGESATARDIQIRIEKLLTRATTGVIDSNDVVVLFISSHGFIDEGDFRLQGNDYDPGARRSTSVSYKEDILKILDRIPCKKIVFIDACHSGGARANVADINFEIQKLNSKKKGTTVIVSSKDSQESYEDVAWENGAFTEAIIRGMGYGLADMNKNKIVTIQELYTWLSQQVPIMVNQVKKKAQNPVMINNELGDVAIFVLD